MTKDTGVRRYRKKKALAGDWIIRGIEGEFYPCKPSIFYAAYEEAPDA